MIKSIKKTRLSIKNIIYNIIIFLFFFVNINAQELNAEVNIDFSKVNTSNTKVFNTLKKSLKDFINNTKWTNKQLKPEQKIKCSFNFIIEGIPKSNQFKSTLIIQSSRPIYSSYYQSPMLNYRDNEVTFDYVEYESLIFNDRKFSGKNLTDVIAFYIYLILGIDADSFSLNGGTSYFQIAKKIADNSINQNYSGWNIFDNPKTRGSLVSDWLNENKSKVLRNTYYEYHRFGLDQMYDKEKEAKGAIAKSLISLEEYKNNTMYYPLSVFILAKTEEIRNIYSSGTPVGGSIISQLKQVLSIISPANDASWSKIKT